MSAVAGDYFVEIGLDREHDVSTLDGITHMIMAHYDRFIYCNVELLSATNPNPKPDAQISPAKPRAVFESMRNTGFGICFQHLELAYAVLKERNVSVSRHLAIPILRKAVEFDVKSDWKSLAHSHETLLIDGAYILDLGFGPNSVQGLIPLSEGEHVVGDSRYRLSLIEPDWYQLDLMVEEDYISLYCFTTAILPSSDVERLHRELYDPLKGTISVRDDYLFFAQCQRERKCIKIIVAESIGIFTRRFDGKLIEKTAVESANFVEKTFGNLIKLDFRRIDKLFIRPE